MSKNIKLVSRTLLKGYFPSGIPPHITNQLIVRLTEEHQLFKSQVPNFEFFLVTAPFESNIKRIKTEIVNTTGNVLEQYGEYA